MITGKSEERHTKCSSLPCCFSSSLSVCFVSRTCLLASLFLPAGLRSSHTPISAPVVLPHQPHLISTVYKPWLHYACLSFPCPSCEPEVVHGVRSHLWGAMSEDTLESPSLKSLTDQYGPWLDIGYWLNIAADWSDISKQLWSFITELYCKV